MIITIKQIDYDYYLLEGKNLDYEENRIVESFLELLQDKGFDIGKDTIRFK